MIVHFGQNRNFDSSLLQTCYSPSFLPPVNTNKPAAQAKNTVYLNSSFSEPSLYTQSASKALSKHIPGSVHILPSPVTICHYDHSLGTSWIAPQSHSRPSHQPLGIFQHQWDHGFSSHVVKPSNPVPGFPSLATAHYSNPILCHTLFHPQGPTTLASFLFLLTCQSQFWKVFFSRGYLHS